MTNEKLESKLAELLNVSSHEESITFLLFKKRVAESLKIGEALKVNDLGVFQLKEQLKKVEKSKAKSSTAGKTVLIFSSDSDGSEKESLFLTLEIEPSKKDSAKFDESVFSIGIGKPTVPISEKNVKGSDTDSEFSIDEKISNLISSSEKLEKYDLWDDYLDGKQSFASLLDEAEEEEISDLEDYLNHDDTTPNPNDFVELDEEELLAEFDDSEIINDEELENNEFIEKVKPEEIEVVIEPEETSEEIIDKPDTVIKEVVEFKNISEVKIDEILEEVPIETDELISDVENVVEDVQDEVIEETEIKLHEEVVEPIAEKVSEVEIEDKITESKIEEPEEEQALLFSSDPEFYNNKEEDKMAHPGMNNFKKGYSPTIIALIIAFFIVGSIGIYYLFFDNPTWLYDQNEVEVTLSEKHAKEFEEAKKRVMAVNTTSNSDDNEPTQTNDKPKVKNENGSKIKNVQDDLAEDTKKKNNYNLKKASIKRSNTKKTSNKKTDTKKTNIERTVKTPIVTIDKPTRTKNKVKEPRTSKIETRKSPSKEVNNNIFFDGTNYSVQISSWKQQSIAEQEVTRLKKKGYSAYVLKAYIPKFKANWHRVRIGKIATLKEAQSIQKNVK
ncbi:MAG: SPOR domain-containing protein [Ignavibacteriae bacterium]|nr:SPOR domain-containing protein [Ignavibacteriota bacterium]